MRISCISKGRCVSLPYPRYLNSSQSNISNKSFDNKFRVYNQARLQIQRIHVDNEFKPIEVTFKEIYITINYETDQGHVP